MTTAGDDDCPLPRGVQVRNLLLFAACTGLIYLSAPVNYVGTTQASLCRKLGASDRVANLPATLFFLMTATPVVLAWAVPQVSALRALLFACFALPAAVMLAVAALLPSDAPDSVKLAAVIAQGAVSGATMPTAIALLWEAIGRGAAERSRGLALALAFGLGPLVALAGSLGEQVLLTGEWFGEKVHTLGYPQNFAALYACVGPALLLAAFLAASMVVPLPAEERPRESFAHSVFGGVANFLADPVLRTAAFATVLLYVGNTIPPNLNLYTQEAVGRAPDELAGAQNAVRFGFKVAAGLTLGWLLTRTGPRLGMQVTGAIFIVGVLWASGATGWWYLLAFGLYGAGELVGVYAPNYILAASRPGDMRRNMALVTLLMLPAAPAGQLFGWLSDHYAAAGDRGLGFRVSFAACAAIMAVGLAATWLLPARPRPAATP